MTGRPRRSIQNEKSPPPFIKISGRKTTIEVKVDMTTARPTSPAPTIEAWVASRPSWRRR